MFFLLVGCVGVFLVVAAERWLPRVSGVRAAVVLVFVVLLVFQLGLLGVVAEDRVQEKAEAIGEWNEGFRHPVEVGLEACLKEIELTVPILVGLALLAMLPRRSRSSSQSDSDRQNAEKRLSG